jgi:hypothetical protein
LIKVLIYIEYEAVRTQRKYLLYKSIDIVDEACCDEGKYPNIYNVTLCGGLKFMLYIQDILIKIFKNFKGVFQEDFRLPNVCKDIAGHSSSAV